jgi:hypothetical protein
MLIFIMLFFEFSWFIPVVLSRLSHTLPLIVKFSTTPLFLCANSYVFARIHAGRSAVSPYGNMACILNHKHTEVVDPAVADIQLFEKWA